MAEHLVQEYLDRAQAAEQATLQLKIQLSTERADFETRMTERSNTVNVYGSAINKMDEQLAEKDKKIADLEKTIEDSKSQAPSNLVAELKEMLQSALNKVGELEGAATPASTPTVKEEPENDVMADELPTNSAKALQNPDLLTTSPRQKQRGKSKPLWFARPVDNRVGAVRTWYVPPHLRTREEAAAAAGRFDPGPLGSWE
ncbi:hypothetical protein LTS10_000126 [Elasticomyces elasticus]|nr:hypothetical protein LTS10_000126 [Elasticomyces elasticus]